MLEEVLTATPDLQQELAHGEQDTVMAYQPQSSQQIDLIFFLQDDTTAGEEPNPGVEPRMRGPGCLKSCPPGHIGEEENLCLAV